MNVNDMGKIGTGCVLFARETLCKRTTRKAGKGLSNSKWREKFCVKERTQREHKSKLDSERKPHSTFYSTERTEEEPEPSRMAARGRNGTDTSR